MLFGGPLWAGFKIGSSDSMGAVKTQYTKYARNAVFDKVLIKNDFPCISQFVSLLFELLLQPFWSLSGEFFCAGCYKQGYRLHKTIGCLPAEKRKTDNVAWILYPVIPTQIFVHSRNPASREHFQSRISHSFCFISRIPDPKKRLGTLVCIWRPIKLDSWYFIIFSSKR